MSRYLSLELHSPYQCGGVFLQVGDVLPQGFTEAAQLGGPLVRPVSATTVTKEGTKPVMNLMTWSEQQCKIIRGVQYKLLGTNVQRPFTKYNNRSTKYNDHAPRTTTHSQNTTTIHHLQRPLHLQASTSRYVGLDCPHLDNNAAG